MLRRSFVAVSRRTFLEKLGLGAGAVLLSPIANTLLSEAHGQMKPRKRAVFFFHGNGMHYDFNFTPAEFRTGKDLDAPIMDGPTAYTWPAMLKPLEPWRQRMLLLDGLANRPKSGAAQHSAGYSALTCFPGANGSPNDQGGQPGGISIDQFIANGIGAGTWRKSVLYGVSQRNDAQLTTIFAAAAEKAEPHFQSPRLLFNDLFGTIATDAAGLNRGALKHRVLLDVMRGDIKRLQTTLAAPERGKLDHYLGAIEEFEKRQAALGVLSCKAPAAAPGAEDPAKPLAVEDKLESMTEMAILALTCGMTNVVGVAAGCGMSHNFMPKYTRIHVGTMFEAKGFVDYYGHEGRALQGPSMDLIHQFHTGLLARMAQAMAGIKEGDKTIFDNTVMMYSSDNAEQHHSDFHHRWPLVLLGDAGGKLKTGGRFFRWPNNWGTRVKGWRSLADLYCTLATACGVPTDTFGKGGNEVVQGPLTELMA